MHVGISLEPAVVLGLMGIEVVENDMEGGITIDSDDVVHEVEKLNAAATLFVSDSDLSGGNLEGSKQGRSAVTLVDAMGRAARYAILGAAKSDERCPMRQQNDLSRSLAAFNQNTTLI